MAEPPSAPVPPEQAASDPSLAGPAADREARDRSGVVAGVEPSPQELGHGAREQYGPLIVARHVKDDGRELILYTRRREE